MAGAPEDWRPVQAHQAGLALALDSTAATPKHCAARLADSIVDGITGPFALCGYSMGGRIALLAVKELMAKGRRPEALILASSGFGYKSPSGRNERLKVDESWAQLAENEPELFWKRWYEQEVFASFRLLPEGVRKAWLRSRIAMDSKILTRQLRNLGPGRHEDLFSILCELATKGLRMLYICGELDKKYLEVSQRVCEIGGITVDVIAGAGHVLPLEAPEELAASIGRFLQ